MFKKIPGGSEEIEMTRSQSSTPPCAMNRAVADNEDNDDTETDTDSGTDTSSDSTSDSTSDSSSSADTTSSDDAGDSQEEENILQRIGDLLQSDEDM